MRPVDPGGATSGTHNYNLLGVVRNLRVQGETLTPIATITAQSRQYLVSYTWSILAKTLDADGAPPLVYLKTTEVDQICGHDHVQGFRTENDQDASQVLHHFAVITVGTDDEAITDEVRWRMDHIGEPGVFGAIDATWERLQALGAE